MGNPLPGCLQGIARALQVACGVSVPRNRPPRLARGRPLGNRHSRVRGPCPSSHGALPRTNAAAEGMGKGLGALWVAPAARRCQSGGLAGAWHGRLGLRSLPAAGGARDGAQDSNERGLRAGANCARPGSPRLPALAYSRRLNRGAGRDGFRDPGKEPC